MRVLITYFVFRYVGNLDASRVTEQMMLDIFKNGLPHMKDKVLTAKMFHPQDVRKRF